MNSNKTARAALIVAIVAAVGVAVIGAIIAFAPEEEPVARSYQCDVYTEQGCDKFVVASGGEIEVQSGGTADFQSGATVGFGGDVTAAGDLDVTGQLSVDSLTLPSFADLALSDGDTITPAYTTYALDTTGDVTITLAAVGTDGQELILIADDANTIIVNDTNIRAPGGGTITMTQYYIIGARFQDSEWLIEYRSVNQ